MTNASTFTLIINKQDQLELEAVVERLNQKTRHFTRKELFSDQQAEHKKTIVKLIKAEAEQVESVSVRKLLNAFARHMKKASWTYDRSLTSERGMVQAKLCRKRDLFRVCPSGQCLYFIYNESWHASHAHSDFHGGQVTKANMHALAAAVNSKMGKVHMRPYFESTGNSQAIRRLKLSVEQLKADVRRTNKHHPDRLASLFPATYSADKIAALVKEVQTPAHVCGKTTAAGTKCQRLVHVYKHCHQHRS